MPRHYLHRFVHRHHPEFTVRHWLKAGAGVFAAFAVVGMVADYLSTPLLAAPLAASATLIFANPSSRVSQPARVIGGHLIAALIALVADYWLPANPWTLAAVVGIAVTVLGLLRLSHPPAAGTAMVVMMVHPSWTYLLTPILAGSAALVLLGVLFHRLPHRADYPRAPSEPVVSPDKLS